MPWWIVKLIYLEHKSNKQIISKLYLVQLIEHPILRILNILFVYFFEYFIQIKVLNWYENAPKNANITHYIKKKNPLCNTLNWGYWHSGFLELGVCWSERDICLKRFTVILLTTYLQNQVILEITTDPSSGSKTELKTWISMIPA